MSGVGTEARNTIALVGNNLAVMAGALKLAKRGRDVVLVNPSPGWGGHFASIAMGGMQFDPGMVLYEFDAYNLESAPRVETYDAERRNDCGRFFGVVRQYVESRMAMVQTPPPSMFLGGRLQPDLVIGNRLDALSDMQHSAPGRRIAAELKSICSQHAQPLHASRKTGGALYESADYATASRANHGETLHEMVFEPLCGKILGTASAGVLAAYHRAAWLPLYYPETLLSQFGPDPQRLPDSHFYYPVLGGAGALAAQLAAEIRSDPRIRIVASPVCALAGDSPYLLNCQDGTQLSAGQLIWGLDPAGLIRLIDAATPAHVFARGSVGLCFLAVPAGAANTRLSTCFVVDPEYVTYRVTNQDVCARSGAATHRIVAEFSLAGMARRNVLDPALQAREIVQELTRIGAINSSVSVAYCATKAMNNVLTLPTAANRSLFQQQAAWIRQNLPGVRLAGPGAGFLAGSMNDQIIQGLKIGVQYGGASE